MNIERKYVLVEDMKPGTVFENHMGELWLVTNHREGVSRKVVNLYDGTLAVVDLKQSRKIINGKFVEQ